MAIPKKIVLALSDYSKHSTSEGNELQLGLQAAGWSLHGFGYLDNLNHVPTILSNENPDIVFLQDIRDLTPGIGLFDVRCCFRELDKLHGGGRPFVVTVIKDAGSVVAFQHKACAHLKPDLIVHQYHVESILKVSPWLADFKLYRFYHTIDAENLPRWESNRRRAIVTGALSNVYPIRQMAFKHHADLGLDFIRHPGYSNLGARTPGYLQAIGQYRVHVATASKYGFALRKIIESVAVGCTPVTDLPAYDILPGIDEALVRIPPGCSLAELDGAIKRADTEWNEDERRRFAACAKLYYDYRKMGDAMDKKISVAAAIRFEEMAHAANV